LGNLIAGQLVKVLNLVVSMQDPSKNLGMQCFDSASQNGRITGQVLNLSRLATKILKKIPGASGGPDFYPGFKERFGQGLETLFGVNGN